MGLINDRPHCTILLGKKGSGKTTLLLKILLTNGGLYKCYKKIIIISSTFGVQYEKVWSKLHRKGLEVYDNLTDPLIQHIIAECKSSQEPTLLVSDDMCSQWRRSVDQKLVDQMISISRHLKLSLIFLSQSIVQLPTSVRRNTDCFIIFGATALRETELIWADVSTISKKDYYRIFRVATQKQFGFLVCTNNGGQLKFYDSFNREFIIEWDDRKKSQNF